MDRRAQFFLIWCLILVFALGNKACFAMPGPQQANSKDSDDAGTTETSQKDSGSTEVKPVSQPDPTAYDNTLGKHVLKDFVQDQKEIWTSPRHVRLVDAEWLVPLEGLRWRCLPPIQR